MKREEMQAKQERIDLELQLKMYIWKGNENDLQFQL